MAPAFEELRRAEFQCCGNERDVFQADISFAAFNSADIAAIQAHSEREVFLTPPTGLPEFADTTAEDASRISVAGEDNGVIKFTRKTPFGTAGWTKKKDNLNAAEKMAVERSARQKDSGAATATAAKPAL